MLHCVVFMFSDSFIWILYKYTRIGSAIIYMTFKIRGLKRSVFLIFHNIEDFHKRMMIKYGHWWLKTYAVSWLFQKNESKTGLNLEYPKNFHRTRNISKYYYIVQFRHLYLDYCRGTHYVSIIIVVTRENNNRINIWDRKTSEITRF